MLNLQVYTEECDSVVVKQETLPSQSKALSLVTRALNRAIRGQKREVTIPVHQDLS
ncbi:hypothetical protein RSAG8_05325, partial [Rhizoctonia solani AG-8 WAC10335]